MRLKRFVIAALIVVGVIVAIAAAVPFIISTDVVKQRISDQITHWTGRAVTFEGDPKISLFPYLTVKLRAVRIANPQGIDGKPFIEMEGLTGKLELLPLMIGRIEIAEFRLIKPLISLQIAKDGQSNWSMKQGVVGTQAAKGDLDRISDDVAPRSPIADISLGRFVVRDGTVTFNDARNGHREEFSAVDVDLAWPSTADSAGGSGRATWRGKVMELSGSLDAPLQLLAGGASPFHLAISSESISATLNGTAQQLDGLQLEGQANIATPSLRGVMAWTGVAAGNGASLGAGTINGTFTSVGSLMSFETATMELDGNAAEGALAIGLPGGSLYLQGTLDSDRLDLTSYIDALRTYEPIAGATVASPLALLLASNIDLRLSASQVVAGPAEFGQAAAAIKVEGGALTIDIGDAEFLGGHIEAHLGTKGGPGTVSGTVRLKVDQIPLLPALTELAGINALDGIASATLEVSGSGADWSEALFNATGTGDVAIADGLLSGIDVNDLPAIVKGEKAWTAGSDSTSFKTLTATFVIEQGAVRTDDLTMEGENYSAKLSAKAGLSTPTLEARGIFAPAENGGAVAEVPFMIGGTWYDPTLSPDLGPPIKRSGADARLTHPG